MVFLSSTYPSHTMEHNAKWFAISFTAVSLCFFIAYRDAISKWKPIQIQPKTINRSYRRTAKYHIHEHRTHHVHVSTCRTEYCLGYNKNQIANAYGAYNLCHLFLLYTQHFLSIYDCLRYKIESCEGASFSFLVSVKMKRETSNSNNNKKNTEQ